jgi:hypothetical protein
VIAFLLLLHPSLSAQLPPGRNSTQYDLFPDSNAEVIDEFAGKILALMASFDALLDSARPDGTGLTVHEPFIRQAALAPDLVYSYIVNAGQSLFELGIVISVGNKDSADATV